jgi:hypothetical protein
MTRLVESAARGSQFPSCRSALTTISTVPSGAAAMSWSDSSPVEAMVPSLAYRLALEPTLK